MAAATSLIKRLGLALPIIQAPMANAGTPALAAAVSDAGGLGSLGVARLSPDEITHAIRATRALTNPAFNVNLFAPLSVAVEPERIESARRLLAPFYREVGIDAVPEAPKALPYGFEEQFEAILAERPPIVSFTFNLLPPEAMRRIKATGAFVLGTATTVAEARALEAAGVDAIVAQGAEAGGHRGSFLDDAQASAIGLMALVPAIMRAVRLPVVAAGGIMDGAGLRAAFALGAAAAQLGTLFLGCPENTAVNPLYKAAVLDAADRPTVITRVYTGRHARMIRNRYVEAMVPHSDALPGYPTLGALTQPLIQAALARGRSDLVQMLAGQGVARTTAEPAAALVARLARELDTAA
jgi:nitronate monooxygenase